MKENLDSLKNTTNRHESRFIVFIGLCFTAMLLSTFMLTLFGVIDLRIAAQVDLPFAVEFGINLILFCINIFFMFSIIMSSLDIKTIIYVLLYIPIHILMWIIFPNCGIIATFIIPASYSLIIYIKLKNGNKYKALFRIVLYFIFVSAYQQLSLFIKLNLFGLNFQSLNPIVLSIYSIDLILFHILLTIGVRQYDLGFNDLRSKGDSIFGVPERIQDAVDLSRLKAHQRFIFWCMAVSYQVFQLIVVLCIGFINNAFVEILVMLAVFWIGRPILKRSWHSDTLTICSLVTFSGFYILTKVTPPLTISLFSCISLSALFVYILYRAGMHEDDYNILKAYKQERDDFNAKSRRGKAKVTLETLSASHMDFNMLQDYSNGETLEIIADKYNLSLSTLNRKINALVRK